MRCLHCGEDNLPPDAMEPLSTGEPSNMCRQCWFEYSYGRKQEMPKLIDKWRRDTIAEKIEAERRALERIAGKRRDTDSEPPTYENPGFEFFD